MTRFVIFKQNSGEQQTQPTGDDKTMLVLCMADRVGALHDVLHAFQERSVNLARIESRPSRSKIWEYIFFVDMHGHCLDANVKEVRVVGGIWNKEARICIPSCASHGPLTKFRLDACKQQTLLNLSWYIFPSLMDAVDFP